MENKNEKSMTLEEMIGEMLKDAKVVKVPLPGTPVQCSGPFTQHREPACPHG